MKMKRYWELKCEYDDGKFRLWTLINGQGSSLAKTGVKAVKGYQEAYESKNCVWLLNAYEKVTLQVHSNQYFAAAIIQARRNLHSYTQKPYQTLLDYSENLEALCKIAAEIDPNITVSATSSFTDTIKTMYEERLKKNGDTLTPNYFSPTDRKLCTDWMEGQLLALLLITNADKYQFGEIQIELHNDFLKGVNNYPASLQEAFSLLFNHKKAKKPLPFKGKEDAPEKDGIVLAQKEVKPTPGIDTKLFPNMECLKCKQFGHYGNQCPGIIGKNLSQIGMMLNQVSIEQRLEYVSLIPYEDLKYIILLDCASTVNFFINKDLVTNIHHSPVPLYLGTNNGLNIIHDTCDYDGLDAWYNPDRLANVLSYGLLTDYGRVVANSDLHSSIFYFSDDHGWMEFENLGCSLYAFDTRNPKTNKSPFLEYSFVQTVLANKSLYSAEQVLRAKGVRKLYVKVRRPGIQYFRQLLNKGTILNCPFTAQDDVNAKNIFSKQLSTIRGRKLRQK